MKKPQRPRLPKGQRRIRVNLMLNPDTVKLLRSTPNASAYVDQIISEGKRATSD